MCLTLGEDWRNRGLAPPEKNSGNDRFARDELSAKGAYVGQVPSSAWGRLAGGCPEGREI